MLERCYDITLEALGGALGLKDAATEGHSRFGPLTGNLYREKQQVNRQQKSRNRQLRGALHTHITLEAAEDAWIVATCPALLGCVSQCRDEREALAFHHAAIRRHSLRLLTLHQSVYILWPLI